MTNTFASTLRRFRTDRKMTQYEIADHACIDHSFPSRLESGKRAPSREIVERLANGLDLTDDERAELFARAGYWPDRWEFGANAGARLVAFDSVNTRIVTYPNKAVAR